MKKALSIILALVLVLGSCACLAGCKKPEENKGYQDDGKVYSYRMAPSDLPESWNVHTYQSNTSTYVLDYSSDSLYTFDYSEDGTRFQIVPSMADGDPIDVTSEYVGKYGIADGDTGRVYKINLKKNLKYDNGEVLNANSFVQSVKNLLNPQAANFRADNLYASGSMKIWNAENYVKQGSSTNQDCTEGEGAAPYQGVEWAFGDDGTSIPKEIADNIYFIPDDCYVGKYSIDSGYQSYVDKYGMAGFWIEVWGGIGDASMTAIANEMTGKSLTEILANPDYYDVLQAILYDFWCTDPNEPFGFFCYKNTWPEMDFSEVGFFAEDDDTLVIVLKNAMELNFYLRYELCTSFFLVYNPLYEQLITMDGGVYNNTYGTGVDSYVGFGPYKLTQFQEGAQIVLERNEYWHGYTPEEYVEGTYQTDRVVYNKVTENSTRLEMFLKGELESYGLQTEDMEDYLSSKYTYFTDGDSVWYLAMNPDYDNLHNLEQQADPLTPGNEVNKTVLTIKEFRQALSWGLDRNAYDLYMDPTASVATALYSKTIVADPEQGIMYRSLDLAKDAILSYWGLADQWGEGKEYATRDEAIASITGYDPSGAKELFTTAYNKAVEQGLISDEALASGKWEVQIIIGKPSESNYYTKGYEFLKTTWTNAAVGTPFEGHFAFIQSQTLGSSSFGSYLRNGQIDLLFGVGFTGSQFDPFGLFEVFTGSLQYDAFTDMSTINATVTIDGTPLTASIYDWQKALTGEEIDTKDANGNVVKIKAGPSEPTELRYIILATLEEAVLNVGNIFPLNTDASASLKCMRVNFKTEEYILGVGRGGIQYYTYSMDDAEFADFIASQGGVLNYKVEE